MPQLKFTTLDVFTSTRYKGNPLAVVHLPPSPIPTSTLQLIAREFNLSETVFLSPYPLGTIRIFLPHTEIPFAGHPVIGTACLLGPKITTLYCPAGPIKISHTTAPNKTVTTAAEIPHAFHLHTGSLSKDEVATLQPSLPLAEVEDIQTISPVRGMNFVAVRLTSVEVLGRVGVGGKMPYARLDKGAWGAGFVGGLFYTFPSHEGEGGGGMLRDEVFHKTLRETLRVRMRMIEGKFEDPATGSAAVALGMFLSLQEKKRTRGYEILQGVEMGRESHISVNVELDEACERVEKVELIGTAVKVMDGVLECDQDDGNDGNDDD
ncbi:Diaminopimelate epimerase-like protein [Piedraia hortae CBS 480.64]|uniref:Diaminopimelate epimerase-like protein n=1 Tax=Piedraia hortae CBS 480.64 TaxID=1314780 RepID=A0A6A7BW87_9PEZI|nr:Diaminopimelate epimerase-like protein [Piedraia hortae CBS 480.64]